MSEEGIYTDSNKQEAVVNFPVPKDVKASILPWTGILLSDVCSQFCQSRRALTLTD